MSDYVRLDLTGDELKALAVIGGDIRRLFRHGAGKQSVGNVVARRGGLNPNSSIRTLCGMDDLRRPRPETLAGLALGIGMPEQAEVWQALWSSIAHPKLPS